MAVAKKPPEFVTKLRKALSEKLRAKGIESRVEFEPLKGTKLYRFAVYAPAFAKMWVSERQDLVWRIASSVLPGDEQFQVSVILTLAPEDLGEEPQDRYKARRRPARAGVRRGDRAYRPARTR
jgi:hypothetical protein